MHLFEALGLQQPLVEAVTDLGFEKPTPVQEEIIPLVLQQTSDVVALSQTGTGKTAAFGLPLLSLLDFSSKKTQALILCPTRELCMQIARDLEAFSTHLKKVKVTAVYGGAPIVKQMKSLEKGSQIIVGTPGRMLDLIKRKKIHLETIDYLVLDEADEMLNMGFKEDLDAILSNTPESKNTWLFSATMPDEVSRISRQYMSDPIEKIFGKKNQGNENISHIYYPLRPRDRYAALKRLADYHANMFAIVFCRTRRETQEIADKLIKDGYSADALHGDLSQGQRDHVMKRYRNHLLQLLVATDVAARGIDVDDITHVVHYSLPDELENYTHRSGRTARAGKKGSSIVFAGPNDLRKIKPLEKIVRKKFEKGTLPSTAEVKEKQLFRTVKNIQETVPNETEIAKVLPEAHACLDYLSREELISRVLSLEYNRMPEVGNKEISALDPKKATHKEGVQKRVKLFLNLGKYDGLSKKQLLSFLSRHGKVNDRAISVVELGNSFSVLRVKKEVAHKLTSGLKGVKLGDRPVRLELRRKKGNSKGKKRKSRK